MLDFFACTHGLLSLLAAPLFCLLQGIHVLLTIFLTPCRLGSLTASLTWILIVINCPYLAFDNDMPRRGHCFFWSPLIPFLDCEPSSVASAPAGPLLSPECCWSLLSSMILSAQGQGVP